MSYFNFSHDLFLEVAELRRFSKFIIDDGIKQSLKMETSEFGIIKNPDDLQFENFRVINGSLQKTITVKSGIALDKNFNFINYEGITNLSVPNDGDWYWIKIKHVFSPIETGTVNISANGTMTGVGTEFTKILRGQPNFPSVIRFENSANIYEYEVNEVISDTQCILAANFVAENNLKYSVVGTFTPGTVVTQDEKYPFRYDRCELTLVKELISETEPNSILNLEFFIARVRVVGNEVEIQDQRRKFYKNNSLFELTNLQNEANPLIGVENVKFNNELSAKDFNLLEICWSVITDNYSFNSSLNLLTVSSIKNGGIYKSVLDIQTNDLFGWYVYVGNKKFTVKQANKNGSQYDLFLDVLYTDAFSSNDEVRICPPYEEIELFLIPQNQNKNFKTHTFPINQAKCIIETFIFSETSEYLIQYRYKNHKSYTQIFDINDGIYKNENSFDSNGDLKIPQIPAYSSNVTSSKIILLESINSFDNILSRIDLGDLKGVNRTSISNSLTFRELKVGRDLQYQYFGDSPVVTLTNNNFISLSTSDEDGVAIKNGVEFTLHFNQKIVNSSNFNLFIKQDSLITDPLGTGVLLKKFEKYELNEFFKNDNNKGFVLKCIFDGDNWLLSHEQIVDDSYWNELDSSLFNIFWQNVVDGSSITTQSNPIILNNVSSLKVRKIGNKVYLKGCFSSKNTLPDFKNSRECFYLNYSPAQMTIVPVSLVYNGDGEPNQTNLFIYPGGICRIMLGDLAIAQPAIFSVDNVSFFID